MKFIPGLCELGEGSTPKSIGLHSFRFCLQLVNVQLNEGLEQIGLGAFHGCVSLPTITIPSTVKKVEKNAFEDCHKLVNVQLNEGLEEIKLMAFSGCVSLNQITFPSTVKLIWRHAFKGYGALEHILVHEKLAKMHSEAFNSCNSLRRLTIQSTVDKVVSLDIVENSTSLETVRFDDEIEEFLSETPLRTWWNQGASKYALPTFYSLIERDILKRLDDLDSRKMRNNLLGILDRIPSIAHDDLSEYYDSIHVKLKDFEWLKDITTLLELAIWKSRLALERDHPDRDGKCSAVEMQKFRMICGAEAVIPKVLAFLLQ